MVHVMVTGVGGNAGTGTMQGPDGSVFTGSWHKDVKHGLGRKVYANGDVYEVCSRPIPRDRFLCHTYSPNSISYEVQTFRRRFVYI